MPCEIGFLIGFNNSGYKILMLKDFRIVLTKHVTFDESKVYGDIMGSSAKRLIPIKITSEQYCQCCLQDDQKQYDNDVVHNEPSDDERLDTDHESIHEEDDDLPAEKSAFTPKFEPRMTRSRFLKNKQNDDDYDIISIEEIELDTNQALLTNNNPELFEPKTYKQAMNCDEKKLWLAAMSDEFDSLINNNTWEIISNENVPENASIVTCRWLFKKQVKSTGIKNKARVIAQGFKDTNNYSQSKLYTPVSCILDIRLILLFANQHDLDLCQLDIKTAFLNSTLEPGHDVYMKMPPGLSEYLKQPDHYSINNTLKLRKAIYGLKISPKRWFIKISEIMKSLRLVQSTLRPCIYFWKEGDKILVILIYVDDFLIASNDKNKTEEIINGLRKHLTVVHLGEPKKYLGIDIIRDRPNKTIKLTQETWIREDLSHFDLGKSKRKIKTPLITNDALHKSKANKPNKNQNKVKNPQKRVLPKPKVKFNPAPRDYNPKKYPYRNGIGVTLFLNYFTRPDISYAVNNLGRRQCTYSYADWKELQRLMRYIQDTAHLGLTYKYDPDVEDLFEIFVDASLGTNNELGRSTTGYAIFIGTNLVDWKTQLQKHVALSSAEAEYVALSRVCREIVSIQALSNELFEYQGKPIIYEDNRAAIKLSKTEEAKTFRHLVQVKYHYVRKLYSDGIIKIKWVGTN